MKKAAPFDPKKQPKQKRSRETVDAILTAAANILGKDGAVRLSTNIIAEKAGVAIASLYQYFPNKEAIVRALFEHELSEELAELTKRTGELKDLPVKDIIHAGVRSVIDVHARTPKLVKSLLDSIVVFGGAEALRRARQNVIDIVDENMRARSGDLRSSKRVDIKSFIVVHAVEGVVHAAVSERPELLKDRAFAEALGELIERFLLSDARPDEAAHTI